MSEWLIKALNRLAITLFCSEAAIISSGGKAAEESLLLLGIIRVMVLNGYFDIHLEAFSSSSGLWNWGRGCATLLYSSVRLAPLMVGKRC